VIGDTILHYKIIEKLGEGGMGVVYLAKDTKLNRRVAIKFLPKHISADAEERKRFEIEAQAAAALNHPNITTIHAIEESGDTIFIVMEYIDGIELKDKIKSGSLPKDECITIAVQIAEGLAVAHNKGIVHRDIKSSNIMVPKTGHVKIMDFGLAKIGSGSQVTKLGTTIGTIAFMSPEQTRGEELDHRTDIWSFGIVLYEMLTGNQPFKGAYDQAIIYSILNEEPELNNMPEEYSHILKKALAKSPEERYQKTSEMLNDLKALKGDSIAKTGMRETHVVKPVKKTKMRWIISFSVIFIMAAVSVYYLFFNKDEGTVSKTSGKEMIVVMPFQNLGPQDEKYFADGVTDEIRSKLASIGDLGVIATSSAEKLAKENKSFREIGKELGVDYILNGSIRWEKIGKNESRVRITPQLIRVSDNTITWSNSYDKVLNDIFAVQNDIAQKVVNQLGGTFANNQSQKETPPTGNLKAYDFYLKGVSYEARGAYLKSDIQASINLYKKAIDLDPNFAQAYAHLSICQALMYWFYYDHSEKVVKEVYENAQKSLQLNPNLAETYLALGYYHYHCKLEYESAIREFSAALKIQPNNASAYFGLGLVYRRMGKFDLAVNNILKGYNLNPLSNEYANNLAETYGIIRDYKKAISQYKKTIELNPDLSLQKISLAGIYILKGNLQIASDLVYKVSIKSYIDLNSNLKAYIYILERKFDAAINNLKSTNKPYENSQFAFTPEDEMLGLIYKYKNEPALSKKYFESAKDELEKKLKVTPQDERLHSSLGIVYAGLGMKDKAVAEGKKGIELLPLKKEAYRGYYRQLEMARIYTLIGDNKSALKQIDFILSIPGDFSVPLLKLDPVYDSLRSLPGYKAIINKYELNID
jgi:TolB-like protein/Flp pilus assembly protein TadD/predicted Ser/Thr protein kinase